MTQNIEKALRTYLNFAMPHEERTVKYIRKHIEKQFYGVTKTYIAQILHDGDFVPHNKPDDHRVYWFLPEHDIEKMLTLQVPDVTYVLVDCDSYPEMIQFLEVTKPYGGIFVHCYSSSDSPISGVDDYLSDSFRITEPMSFYQAQFSEGETVESKVSSMILSDLKTVIDKYCDCTCFVITDNSDTICGVNELQDRFMESDLYVGQDIPAIQNMILTCM